MTYLFSFIIYYLIVLCICVIAYRAANNLSDYILGGRSLSAAVAALGVGASDMSSWLLMALPGAAYLNGISEIWMPIGLLIGAYCNWRVVASRLRLFTEMAGDALTIPSYLGTRLCQGDSLIRSLTALIILFFFTIYAAAGFKGGGLVFSSVFSIDPHIALLIGAIFIVLYTSIGGFLAISWVDFAQGALLFCAIIIIPLTLFIHLPAPQHTSFILNLQHHWLPNKGLTGSIISIASLLAWGLGYFGQPHILVRFMAIKNIKSMANSRRIHILWMFFALLGAFAIGLLGRSVIIGQLANPESVLIALAKTQLAHWLAGLLFAIMLSAIMSAISAQLLAASSAITADIYAHITKRQCQAKHLLRAGRITVFVLGIIAICIAMNPAINILHLVSYAWAGLGASFGPIIILSIFWRRLSTAGAIAGIIIAAITVVVWKELHTHVGGIFNLYEIIPAFILGLTACYLFSILLPNKKNTNMLLFDKMRASFLKI